MIRESRVFGPQFDCGPERGELHQPEGIGWARRAEIIRLSFDRDHRILPHPICPAVFDDLAGVEGHGQPDAEGLRGIGIVTCAIASVLTTLKEPSGCFLAASSCCHLSRLSSRHRRGRARPRACREGNNAQTLHHRSERDSAPRPPPATPGMTKARWRAMLGSLPI